MRRFVAVCALGLFALMLSACEESSKTTAQAEGDDSGGSASANMSMEAPTFDDENDGNDGGFDEAGGGGLPGEDAGGYEDGFDPSGNSGPPEGWDEDDGGYGEGFDPSGNSGPPEGWDDEDGGYGEGFDPSGNSGPPEGFDDDPNGGYGEGFDPSGNSNDGGSGGASAPGLDAPGGGDDAGYPGGFPGAGGPPGGQQRTAAKPKSEGLLGKAEAAFIAGRDSDGFAYLYALALTDEQSGMLDKVQWVSGLRHPALAIRWGVGVSLSKPKNFNKSYFPIGTDQNLPQVGRRGGDGGGFGGYGDGGIPDLGDPSAGGGGEPGYGFGGGNRGGGDLLSQTTGELSEQVLEGFRRRVQDGLYGLILKDMADLAGTGGNRGGAGGGFGEGGFPYGDEGGGGGAAGTAGELGAPSFGPPGAGGPPGPGPAAGNRQDDREEDEGGLVSLMPGVSMLGEGSMRELQEQAQDEGLDVLVLFDVDIKEIRRSGLVTNECRIMVYRVSDGELIARSKELNNIQVQRARAESEDDDPVQEAITKLFDDMESEEAAYAMSEMPEGLLPEHVIGRVAALVSSQPQNLLAALTEIKFYHHRNLLDDNTLTQAFQRLVGELDGQQLAQGTKVERMKVVEQKKWLPAE